MRPRVVVVEPYRPKKPRSVRSFVIPDADRSLPSFLPSSAPQLPVLPRLHDRSRGEPSRERVRRRRRRARRARRGRVRRVQRAPTRRVRPRERSFLRERFRRRRRGGRGTRSTALPVSTSTPWGSIPRPRPPRCCNRSSRLPPRRRCCSERRRTARAGRTRSRRCSPRKRKRGPAVLNGSPTGGLNPDGSPSRHGVDANNGAINGISPDAMATLLAMQQQQLQLQRPRRGSPPRAPSTSPPRGPSPPSDQPAPAPAPAGMLSRSLMFSEQYPEERNGGLGRRHSVDVNGRGRTREPVRLGARRGVVRV